jgi:hypothetical protein
LPLLQEFAGVPQAGRIVLATEPATESLPTKRPLVTE